MTTSFINRLQNRRGFLRNAQHILTGKIIAALFGLLTFIFIARGFTPSEVGDYQYLLSLIILCALLASWGLNEYIFRECSQKIERANEYFVVLRAIKYRNWSAFGSVLVLVVWSLHSWREALLASLLVLMMVYDAQTVSANVILRARRETHAESWLLPLRAFARFFAAFVIYLFALQISLTGLAVFFVLINMLVYFYYLRRFFSNLGTVKSPSLRESASYMRAARHYGLIGLVSGIYLHGISVMVKWWQGAEAVAYIAVPLQVYGALLFIPIALGLALIPRLSPLYLSDFTRWSHLSRKITIVAAVVFLPFTLVCYFVLPKLIPVLFGEKYGNSVLFTEVFIVMFYFRAVTEAILLPALFSAKRENAYLKFLIAVVLIFLIGAQIVLYQRSLLELVYLMLATEVILTFGLGILLFRVVKKNV